MRLHFREDAQYNFKEFFTVRYCGPVPCAPGFLAYDHSSVLIVPTSLNMEALDRKARELPIRIALTLAEAQTA